MKLLFSVKREEQDCTHLSNVPTFAVWLAVGRGRLEALGISADRRERLTPFSGRADLRG